MMSVVNADSQNYGPKPKNVDFLPWKVVKSVSSRRLPQAIS